jgi:hypothetical protein
LVIVPAICGTLCDSKQFPEATPYKLLSAMVGIAYGRENAVRVEFQDRIAVLKNTDSADLYFCGKASV